MELKADSETWERVGFDRVFQRPNIKAKKIKASNYQEFGSFPIIDQGKKQIVGWTDDESCLIKADTNGFVIFGDHTRTLKLVTEPFALGADGTQLLRVNDEFDLRFAFYLLSSKEIPNTGYNRHFKFLKEMDFLVPRESEQIAIAEALSDIDELINSLKLELNKKVLLLDSLRCELIPNNFLNSNLPVGWEVRRLGDVGNITGAGVDKVIRTDGKFVKLVNYMDVYRNLFIDEKIAFMNTTATQAQIQYCNLNEGDVLFTPTSETPEDIAQSAVIKGNLRNCLYSYHLVRFRPNITFNVDYLAHCFNLTDFKRQTLRGAEGSGTRYVITLPRFRNLEFPFPDLAEQERIGRCLSEAAEEVSNAKLLLTKYRSVKHGMMNDLLTGKVRLV